MTDRPSNGSKPKLLLLIPELLTGGAARVFRNQADAFAASFAVDEAVFDEAHGMDFAAGRPVISLHDALTKGTLRAPLNLLRRSYRLRRVKRERSTDVTISHLDGAHRVNILSGGPDLKVLVVHGSLTHDRSLRGLRGLVTRRLVVPLLYNRADRIVTVSRDLIKELAGLGVRREKMSVINNALDIGSIEASSRSTMGQRERALFGGPPVLVTTSRLHAAKNPLRLLDMFAALRRRRPARLLLIGDGPLRETAVRHSEGLGLRTFSAWRDEFQPADCDVCFFGARENPFPYICASDLFLLPSLWEGFPMSLCEALACGVPAVAADCPTGPREILAPATSSPVRPIEGPERAEYGMLMPLLERETSVRVWVEMLVQLLDNKTERARLGSAGKIRIQDFSAARIFAKWRQLIDELLAEH